MKHKVEHQRAKDDWIVTHGHARNGFETRRRAEEFAHALIQAGGLCTVEGPQ